MTSSTSTWRRTLAIVAPFGAAQAELADALRDALPDHAGQAERDHQQQERRRSVPTTMSGMRVLAQLVLAHGVERLHLERPVAGDRHQRA